MKTDELTGSALDYWVARAEGIEPSVDQQMKFCPSTDWSLAGPIIERERIMICWDRGHWIAGAADFANSRKGRIVKGADGAGGGDARLCDEQVRRERR